MNYKSIEIYLIKIALVFGVLTFAEAGNRFKNNENYRNYVFINDCNRDEVFERDLALTIDPVVIINCPSYWVFYDRIPIQLPSLPRLGPNRYTHIFYKVIRPELIGYWQELYSRLTLTQQKLNFFEYASLKFKKYPFFDKSIFKSDYDRSQWNQDKFIIKDSHDIVYGHLIETVYDQLPTYLQRDKDKVKEISKIFLMYSTLSGWGGSQCNFVNPAHQFSLLTDTYNAFDMLFCDVFNYYNITPMVDYNFREVRWIRNFFFRDDLVSSFPPDSNAVFYESPGITFVILKEPPIIWTSIVRPFTFEVWVLIVTTSISMFICSKLISKEAFDQFYNGSSVINLAKILRFFTKTSTVGNGGIERALSSSNNFFRMLLTSAYSGMILGGILDPSYPWSPKTFKELNETTNYIVATSKDSAVGLDRLINNNSYLLNGVKDVIDREDPGKGKNSPGMYLIDDDKDPEHRYALTMFDDNKYHWIYSKHQLWLTHKYIHRLEMDKEVVRREMRYISVPPGATKLHFIIQGIRNTFETGSWIKWRNLEKNYFKYVAPIVIRKYYGVEEAPLLRTLTYLDIRTNLCVWAIALALAIGILIIETIGISLGKD